MTNLDFLFFAATLALGWGLSLATYRVFALRNDWPMGELHANKPLVPVLLGVFAIAIAFLFAAFRAATVSTEMGGWWILPAGLLWAFFWTGFMRVGSQSSLFLAPIATDLLMIAWINVRTPPDFVSSSSYEPNSFTYQSGGNAEADNRGGYRAGNGPDGTLRTNSTSSARNLNGFGNRN
jgi:hypothetical protein